MRFFTAVLLFVTGCGLTGHDDVACRAADEPAHSQQLRDPITGQCRFESSCTGCEPCPSVAQSGTVGSAVCDGPCEALTEAACLDTKSCHTAYRTDSAGVASFVGCWAVATGRAPNNATDCTQLDVRSCPFRDDCAAWYAGPGADAMSFDHCALERESCAPGTCGAPLPCPSNSVATTRNGCYTGHCMARSQCPAST